MATVLVLTGNPLLDHLAATSLEAGAINRCQELRPVCGGKGLNVGRVLARHGHRVLACGLAGGAPATTFRRLLEAEGQEYHYSPCAADLRLGFLCQDCAGAGATGLLQSGFNISADELARCQHQISALLAQSDLVICSGSMCDPLANTLYAWLSEAAAVAEIPCWVDSYGAPMAAALASASPPLLSKPNREEFTSAFPWERAEECHISDGEGALEIRSGEKSWRLQPPAVHCVNPVGSGDSYLAALAHARLSEFSFADSICYAAAAGALNASMMAVADLEPAAIAGLAQTLTLTCAS